MMTPEHDAAVAALQAERDQLLREVDVLIAALQTHSRRMEVRQSAAHEAELRALIADRARAAREAASAASLHRKATQLHAAERERLIQQHAVDLRMLQDSFALQLRVAEAKATAALERIAELERQHERELQEKDAFIQQLQAEHAREMALLLKAQLPGNRR